MSLKYLLRAAMLIVALFGAVACQSASNTAGIRDNTSDAAGAADAADSGGSY